MGRNKIAPMIVEIVSSDRSCDFLFVVADIDEQPIRVEVVQIRKSLIEQFHWIAKWQCIIFENKGVAGICFKKARRNVEMAAIATDLSANQTTSHIPFGTRRIIFIKAG